MKLAKIPQLGAQVASQAGKAAEGFGALLEALAPQKPAKKAPRATTPAGAPEKVKPAKAGQKPRDSAEAVVVQLAHVQALVPHAPLQVSHSHQKHEGKPAVELAAPLKQASAERPAPLEPPAPTKEPSAQPAAIFTLTDAPREAPKAPAPAPPAWLPNEVVADDTARLTLFPHSANLTAEGHAMHLQVRDGEVTLRIRGELAAQMKSSESELRVALAQEGLKLRETESTHEQSDDHRRKERDDEWT